jgi:RNA polymerase sigma-70 factor (ECF subfamily)
MDDVLRYAMVRLGNHEDAEDVAARVFDAGHRMPACEDPRLYLLGIARRKVADALRQRGRRVRGQSLDSLLQEPGHSQELAVDRRTAVAMVLDRLSDDHREALALKYLNDLSVDEIAAVMGRSSAAVNSLLQRAREAFANAAGDRFQEDFL